MAYAGLHILNLHDPRAQAILADAAAYALEKVDGTPAHLAWSGRALTVSSGAAPAAAFGALFDRPALEDAFWHAFGESSVTVYGEAFGASVQGLAGRYGPDLGFAPFDVRLARRWLDVPAAERAARSVGVGFVPYELVPCTLVALDAARDAPSAVAAARGMGAQPREGVILRPVVEREERGLRVIAKHKRAEDRETASVRAVDPAATRAYEDDRARAEEWMTPARLRHVLDHLAVSLGRPVTRRDTAAVLDAAWEDVAREGGDEVPATPSAVREVRRRASDLLAAHFRAP